MTNTQQHNPFAPITCTGKNNCICDDCLPFGSGQIEVADDDIPDWARTEDGFPF